MFRYIILTTFYHCSVIVTTTPHVIQLTESASVCPVSQELVVRNSARKDTGGRIVTNRVSATAVILFVTPYTGAFVDQDTKVTTHVLNWVTATFYITRVDIFKSL